MLHLYEPGTGRVEEIAPARAGIVRVSCAGGLRPLVVADVIRRLLGHHRVRAVGIWDTVPGASDLGVRPAELSSGEADIHIGETVGHCSTASWEGIDALAVRLALLRSHYGADVSLSREDLAEADASLTALRRQVARWAESPGRPLNSEYVAEAVAALDSDLDTPAVFPLLARLADDASVPPGAKFETVVMLDMILGLDLVGLVGRL